GARGRGIPSFQGLSLGQTPGQVGMRRVRWGWTSEARSRYGLLRDETVSPLGRKSRARGSASIARERVRALARLFDVDSCLRVAEEAAVAAGTRGEDLAHDRQSGFGGRVCADVQTRGTRDSLELVLLDAGLEEALAPALLVSPRPEGADVEGLRSERALDRGDVELVVVRQHDDRSLVVRLRLVDRLLRPDDEQRVRARDALLCRELAASIRNDRPPAQLLRRGAQRLRGVDRADHEQARSRPVDLGEHPPA